MTHGIGFNQKGTEMKRLLLAITLLATITHAETRVAEVFNYFKAKADESADHFTNATAHASIFAGYVPTNDSRVVNAVTNVSNLALVATPISTLSTGATVTITPTYQQKVYEVTASASTTTLTNDFSALNLNGTTNISYTVGITYPTTNTLSTVWDSRIEWIGLASTTPDLTVTGRYEFAFSTSDGVKIQGRQVYPTVYGWSMNPLIAGGTYSFNSYSLSATAPTTTVRYHRCSTVSDYMIHQIHIMSENANSTNTILTGVVTGSNETPSEITTNEVVLSVQYTDYFLKIMRYQPQDSYMTAKKMVYCAPISSTTGHKNRMYDYGQKSRPANELEIKAYNAGWRP